MNIKDLIRYGFSSSVLKVCIILSSLIASSFLIAEGSYAATLTTAPTPVVPSTSAVQLLPIVAVSSPSEEAGCPQPPAQSEFDHATFSDAQLKEYGMAPRAMFKNVAQWQDVVRHELHNNCHLNTISIPGGPEAATNEGTHTSGTWGGYVEQGNGYGIFIQANSYFNVPIITSGPFCQQSKNPSLTYQFVGVGGSYAGSNDLVQVGTYVQTICNTASDLVLPYDGGFYENLGNVPGSSGYSSYYGNWPHYFNFTDPIGEGDAMWGNVYYNGMYLQDDTTGDYMGGNGNINEPVFGPDSDGVTFECINERAPGNSLTPATDASFGHCFGYNPNGDEYNMGTGPSYYSFWPDYIVNNGTTLQGFTRLLYGNGDFVTHFESQ